MNWTMPYPWRSRSDSVRRINMSSEPGNESFFCALRPIPRILSLRRRDYPSQVQIGEPSRRKTISGAHAAGCESLSLPLFVHQAGVREWKLGSFGAGETLTNARQANAMVF